MLRLRAIQRVAYFSDSLPYPDDSAEPYQLALTIATPMTPIAAQAMNTGVHAPRRPRQRPVVRSRHAIHTASTPASGTRLGRIRIRSPAPNRARPAAEGASSTASHTATAHAPASGT